MAGSGTRRWLLWLLLALCVTRLWLMPLPSSYWLDETATIFVARHGSDHASLAIAAPQAWRSWYYPLIRWEGILFGHSEVATRLLSVFAMAGFLALFARIAKRLIHPEAGWFAVFACLALPGINYQAANARPYAVGMLVFASAVLLLLRWLESGRWSLGVLFAIAAAVPVYFHLLFWPTSFVLLVYAVVRFARHETPVTPSGAIAIFALWSALLVPAFLETASLMHDARAHVISPVPSFSQLFRSLEPRLFLVCAGGAWLLARLRRQQPEPAKVTTSALVLIGAWWLCQPGFLYAFSRLTGNGLFVPRYLQLALPGAAMAATAAGASFIPARQWKLLAATLGFGVFLYLGQWRTLWPRHHNSDWRAAAGIVNQIAAAGAVPVVCPSPFVEARPPAWHPSYALPGFLYTHLDVYPIRGEAVLLPFETSPEAESFAASMARDALLPSHRFLIYGWGPQVNFWRDWFTNRREFAAWHSSRLGPFADVDVVEFDR